MVFTRDRWYCLALFIACAVGVDGPKCTAETAQELPRLCMPVSYRQASLKLPIDTKFAMLEDRYREVKEAVSGWKQSGAPLTGKVGDRWEAVPCGDDTGLFYLVPLLARHTGWDTDRSLNVFLLGILLLAATTGLVGLWLTSCGIRQRALAVVPIVAATYISLRMGDVYIIQASVAIMSIPWLYYVSKTGVRSRQRVLITFLCGIILGFGQWIRTQSASPVLLFFAVVLWCSPVRRFKKGLLAVTLVTGMTLPLLYSTFPIHQRDRFLVRHQPGYRPSLNHHLLWHTAYVGLGYLTNPYVSAWQDSLAVSYVQGVDPATIYGGKEYETILRKRVEEIARYDPKFIFYTVTAKAGVLASILVLCINMALGAALCSPKTRGIELAFWLAMAFAALPGIIAIPQPQYVLGMIVLALYYWYYSITFFLDKRHASS
jgi:hypothetical protein